MASTERPYLSRTHSEDKSVYLAEEDEALLTGQPSGKKPNTARRWTEAGLFVWAIAATVVVVVLSVVLQQKKDTRQGVEHHDRPTGKRNMIFMVSDGMGPASLEMTRSWRQLVEGLPYDDVLVLDQHLIGSSRTQSSDSLVTDSAAGATAFSCGLKSYNGAISVLPDHTPCGTVLEAAKKAGYKTGLVVTTRITDATPACFASHVNVRAYEDLIAEQLIGHYPLGQTVDLLVGGGRCHFLPNTTVGSCREDDKDLVAMAKSGGFSYIDNRKDFDKLSSTGDVKLPLLALLASGDIPFEVDRRHVEDQYPSQYEMAKFALDTLSAATKDSDKGFFIMIEGSRIDHAGHLNDPAAQVHEVLMHDKTFAAALEFLENSKEEGILVSTSDHETGGLSAAKQIGPAYPHYGWYPQALENATHSATYASNLWSQYRSSMTETLSRNKQEEYLMEIISKVIGIADVTADEIAKFFPSPNHPGTPPIYLFANMISRRAQIGWSTHGHSAVDVNIYASKSAFAAQALRGNHENTEVGRFMADYLDVDVEAVTKELIDKGTQTSPEGKLWGFDWMGPQKKIEARDLHHAEEGGCIH